MAKTIVEIDRVLKQRASWRDELPDTEWRCEACGSEWTMPPEGGALPECCADQAGSVQVKMRGIWTPPASIHGGTDGR